MNILRLGRVSVYGGKIERGSNGEDKPWRGYCWGTDWPKANVQKTSACNCLDLVWLCFFVSIYWNKRWRNERPNKHSTER